MEQSPAIKILPNPKSGVDPALIKRRESSGRKILKRIWKKLKRGPSTKSRKENSGVTGSVGVKKLEKSSSLRSLPKERSPVSDLEVTPRECLASRRDDVKSEGDLASIKGDDFDDSSVSSGSSSTSSSDSYMDGIEDIIFPTKKLAALPVSPKKAQVDESSAETTEPDEDKQDEKTPSFNLKLLTNTQFPDFEIDSIPGSEFTDESDDDSTYRKKAEAYATKEDQDVAVFTDIAKRLPIKSLLHLLQGHVRTQNLPADYLVEYNEALKPIGGKKKKKRGTDEAEDSDKKPRNRTKKFRWAEVTDSKVRAVVHEVESLKSCTELWWTAYEMNAIRTELIEVVKFFRRRRPNYINSVEIVAKNNQGAAIVEEHMKQLMADSFPRGLETHIVKMLSDHRKSTITAVLEEQKECQSCKDDYDTMVHCLREQSLAYSQMSTKFAANMGKCDEIDALKAGMSRWRATPVDQNSEFFS